MTHWRALIEKDYLGAWDLVDRDGSTPRDYTLQIQEVKSVALKTKQTPDGKRKCVIRFRGARKRMVSNTTNCTIIESLYGRDIEGWVGKLITLYQGDVRNPAGRGMIKGICVRPKVPKGKPEEVQERPVDEEMRNEQNEAFGRTNEPAEREPGED